MDGGAKAGKLNAEPTRAASRDGGGEAERREGGAGAGAGAGKTTSRPRARSIWNRKKEKAAG